MTEERPTESTDSTESRLPADASQAPPPASYTPPTYPPQPTQPEPAVGWAPAPAAAVAVGERSGLSLAAGIILVILGILGALASLAALTIGREVIRQFDFSSLPGLEQVNDPTAFVESVVTFGAIFLLVCSTFYIVGGVGVIRSKSWGRVIGIIIGVLAGLFWLLGLTGGAQGGRGDLTFAIVLLLCHLYVLIALAFFWRTKTSTSIRS